MGFLREKRSGITMVELLIASVLFSGLIALSYNSLMTFTGRASEALAKRLILQMEARKALLSLYREVQEGIEVLLPQPGSTLPYLVYRDFVNNIHVVYLEKDDDLSALEKEELFSIVEGVKDPGEGTSPPPKILARYVTSLNFTAHHYGGVLISCSLKGGKGRFALVNYVRLKNITVGD